MGSEKPKRQYGGGVFIAVGTIGGALIGQQFGEPSRGVIIGLVVGVVIAVLIAMRNREVA